MRQLVYAVYISNNHASLHFWCKKNLVKHLKVSKYYENDCSYKSIYVDVDCNDKMSFQPLTNVTKNSIIDVAWVLYLMFLDLSKIPQYDVKEFIFCKIDCFRATALLKGTTLQTIFHRIGYNFNLSVSICPQFRNSYFQQYLSVGAVVFISDFFEYSIVWYFKCLIICIKGYLQTIEDT